MDNVTRVFDLLDHCTGRFVKNDLLAGKSGGEWTLYSTEKVVETVNQFSHGLIANGIGKGDRIALMSKNRPEWNFCDFGVMQVGAVLVPMYPTLAEQDIRFILKDAEVKMIFISDAELTDKMLAIIGTADIRLYTFDEHPSVPSWKTLLSSGEGREVNLELYKNSVLPDDLLTLIYTSGTTGTPKGVMLSHANLLSNVKASCVLYPSDYQKALSFLPLCHIFERMVVYMYFYIGISIYYAESMETIVADLNTVKPDGFTTVPRLLEKVYDKIVAKGTDLKGIKKNLFFWALALGLRYELYGKNGAWYSLQLWLARKLIFKKWKEALGGNIKAIVSGGAALQPRLARIFWAAGIPVLEGYGLTETSPVIAVNGLKKGQMAFNSVGKPLSNVQVKIAPDGEILTKGPNLMLGYYKRPDLSAEVIDPDGYFHTGDIGQLDSAGFLCITDRKKEIFKTAGGKYIAPQILENKFKESTLIEQIMVIGENKKFPAALIVPAFDILKSWCEQKNILWTDRQQIIRNDLVLDKYQRELDRFNRDFGHWEQIKKFVLIPDEWSIEHGEMTPKLSLKRKVIMEKYKSLVEEIYPAGM